MSLKTRELRSKIVKTKDLARSVARICGFMVFSTLNMSLLLLKQVYGIGSNNTQSLEEKYLEWNEVDGLDLGRVGY
jgi:hypothetical protein